MSRVRVEKNIAWDDVKERYYVTLYYGIDANGKKIKNQMTCTSKKEAQKILRDHQKSMAAGTAAPPVKNTLSECTKDFIDYKALTLEKRQSMDTPTFGRITFSPTSRTGEFRTLPQRTFRTM